MTSLSEDEIQKNIISELHIRRIDGVKMVDYVHHSPNGAKRAHKINDKGKRYSPEGQKLKAMGTVAGFPDLFIFKAMQGYHGLFVELKKPKKNKYLEIIKDGIKPAGCEAEPSQIDMLSRLNQQGYLAVVAYGHAAAIQIIVEYLTGQMKFTKTKVNKVESL